MYGTQVLWKNRGEYCVSAKSSKPTVSVQLASSVYLALKAGLACLLGLGLNFWLGNPDHVSVTFIAVLCVSPTVLVGLRRARAQLFGSFLGGGLGLVAMLLELPLWVGIPLAVGGAVGLTFASRIPAGYQIAAFAALFVQAVPFGDPLETIQVRALSVCLGGISGFVVNAVVSSHAYQSIFRRRLYKVREAVLVHLSVAAKNGPDAVQPLFAALGELDGELGLGSEELAWRRRTERDILLSIRRRVRELRHLLHVAVELHYLLRSTEPISQEHTDMVFQWLEHPTENLPEVSTPLTPALERLWRAYKHATPDS